MKLVVDTNVFCGDYRMSGAGFSVLRGGLHLVPADLKVPQVVIDEVVNRFREDLLDAIATEIKAHSQLRRVLPAHEPSSLAPEDANQKANDYREWLLSELATMGAEILPYPEVPHEKVVQRDLARKSPFKRTGAGYRDYLIWESTRRLTYTGQDIIVLLTANKADFGDGGLQPDLEADLLNPDDVRLVSGLKEFNDTYIIPKLPMAEELKTQLEAEVGGAFDIPAWLHNNLVDVLRDEDGLEIYVLGFPDGVGSAWPSTLIELKKVNVDTVLRLSDDRVVVKASAVARIGFSVDINWEDYIDHEEVRDYLGESEPFSSAMTDQVATLTLGFSFVLDNQGTDLVDSELGSIDSEYASADWSSW